MTAKKAAAPKPEPAEVAAPPERELLDVQLGDVTVHVFADARDDFEILDEVARLEEGDVTRLPVLLRRLMPEVDRKAALETARGANGRVLIGDALDLMRDLFAGMRNPN